MGKGNEVLVPAITSVSTAQDLRWESCTSYSTKSTAANMVGLPRKEEVIETGNSRNGNRYSPKFRFRVVLEVLKGDRSLRPGRGDVGLQFQKANLVLRMGTVNLE